jgi:predicted component of type VI protein secretion system
MRDSSGRVGLACVLSLAVLAAGCSSTARRQSTTPPNPRDLRIVAEGFSDLGVTRARTFLSYGLIIENPNKTAVAENTALDLTFADRANRVVHTEHLHIPLVLPNQRVAVTETTNVIGVTALRATMRTPTWLTVVHPLGELTASNVAVDKPVNGSLRSSATISSTFATTVPQARVSFVYYDRSHKIVGGSFTYTHSLAPGQHEAVAIIERSPLFLVVRAEAYPFITDSSLVSGDVAP